MDRRDQQISLLTRNLNAANSFIQERKDAVISRIVELEDDNEYLRDRIANLEEALRDAGK